MKFLPLFVELKDRSVLIVGGGEVALRKARLLQQAGAKVSVISPEVDPHLRSIAEKSGGECRLETYQIQDLTPYVIVVAATNHADVNKAVAEHAHQVGVSVNVVDKPDLGNFIFPAIVDRSPVIAAVSSGGASPVLARLLRTRLESLIPAGYGKLAALAEKYRSKVKAKFSDVNRRRGFWETVLHGKVANLVFAGQDTQAESTLQALLEDAADEAKAQGEVYLVGAGPGDPDLLTFKALRLMQQADVVLYDRLVSEPILKLCRRDAKMINVGKARSNHTVPQDGINQMLVDYAKKGHRVLRLKGGDPFIFGRGGEEIERLSDNGVDFQVVPGITAASGCSSYAGIPLTHRDYAQSVRFVTGHLKDNSANLPWSELAYKNQTIVFYMGLMGLPIICEQLIAHGMGNETPIALVQQGTTLNQKVIIATLDTMVDVLSTQQIKAPTLIIVGDVVKLHDQLKWFNPQA
ncbi:uroporphyrinogen-III C-methyltransferase [Bermanella marisrubri]|uniref:Siroheme synthase n=1 Tax=Bermanella marisrubri TaxID=207949 RepID=Q1N4M1_9GAMM|nr:siroheme synthase CysG [Bermanella marisrubri]EAT13407.1 Uroporphyrin-III C-methyltransferase-like protein [Oceanobacter sp. RED65] [Bermanella marisrubri]QIZ84157.1 uroporphyrinogen-III C-methyltransferase [Bermanella marisrubri]